MRPSGRTADQMRPVSFETGVAKHAEGSCLVKFGDTHVLCTASLDEKVPGWLKGQGKGWVTAEYGMLPRSTHSRMDREAARGKQTGRTQEIQRLIGRALRSVCAMELIGERQIRVDCDVLQADGGTRTAAISGAYVALHQCFTFMKGKNLIDRIPLVTEIAAISCGIVGGTPVLDLDYSEDSNAGVDANFVITGTGALAEIQGTAEGAPFSEEEFLRLLRLARIGTGEIFRLQRQALGLSA